jgi:hypothetical protein
MEAERIVQAYPPRLMSAPIAARYLSLSESTIREKGPTPKRYGKRVLWDRFDLDRWADSLSEQPLDEKDRLKEAAEEERRFFEARAARGKR